MTATAPKLLTVEKEKGKKKVRTLHEQCEMTWAQLENDFNSWKPHYQELSTFYLPRNGRFLISDRNRGERRHNSILDNTGTRSLRVVGSGLMAGATSPARPWFRVVTSDPELNRSHSVRSWLDEVTKLILRVFAKSNAYRVLHMMYEELATFGTAACIVTEDAESVIHLHPMTCGEYRLATNWKGEVDTCYRSFERTVGETVGEFGYENCSLTVQQAYDDGQYQNRVQIRHVIEPRRERDAYATDNRNMPFRSLYYEVGRDEDQFLRDSGFERFPVLAPRWSAVGGDIYGHGPGMEALGDVKQLQHEQLRKAQGIDFQTLPPMLMPSEAKGQETKWIPGGTTYVNSSAPGNAIKPAFEVKLDLSHLLADIQDVRERIKGAFFADLFLMLTFQNSTQRMTATEVAERHEEKLIQLGPVLERLHTELLSPLVRLAFEHLEMIGALPPTPPEMESLDLSLEFISMLAQAQRAVGVAGIERVLLIAGNVAGVKKDILDNLSEDDLWAELVDMIGAPARISTSPDVRDKLRRGRLAAENAAAQIAAQNQQADTAQKLAASPTGGAPNALQDVISAFSGYDSPPAKTYG